MKHVLSVQDLSCVGKCSLTVALPVLSAMRCRCSVLPTAVLSTHTAFPSPHVHDLTEQLDPIRSHWQRIGVRFDAICVGYLANPAQTGLICALLDTFPALTVIDPVLGDHGRLYSGITASHVDAMKTLCRKGSILLPNVTEAALLTGLSYRETGDPGYCRELTAGMLDFGAESVVITGICAADGTIGFVGAHRESGDFSCQLPRIPRQQHGSGDLFAAVFTGALMNGLTLSAAAALAAEFVARVLSDTPETTPFGIDFEPQLPWLWSKVM